MNPLIKELVQAKIAELQESIRLAEATIASLKKSVAEYQDLIHVKPLVAIAGDWWQFKDFCVKRGINPHHRNITYASSPDVVRGLRNVNLVVIGTASSRADYFEIMENLSVAGYTYAVEFDDYRN